MTIGKTHGSNVVMDLCFAQLSVHVRVGGLYSMWRLSFFSSLVELWLMAHICTITWITVKLRVQQDIPLIKPCIDTWYEATKGSTI